MIRCPCCNCLTIDDSNYPIVEICEVCYWQYDVTAQKHPDERIGPNSVALNEAKENYKKFGAVEYKFVPFVRKPRNDEL